ncbi:hypothetical protein D3875_20125 [Deinococcus cavernae]|uniref:Uncharacterized protein n=1 Tax=Deinococcus cavernae TaxID=2320857 RepID=A0A418VBL6_9DEIO|nr:DUF6582 domain-containing protein [Deinococcus cavernae]RJF70987.1 hypothetical protein D3875_04680 [Deinococcus cavernae]RJF70988.1 hypothetical protein D3875_04685 [Deinococcus cavernae]RJF73507.1 hypothetical protein D3875_20125 [Deinococcus cavernae]
MSELTSQKRDHLKDSDFAYIDKRGERHLPIHDAQHVRGAAARFNQTQFGSQQEKLDAARRIKSAALKQGVALDKDDEVMKLTEEG